MSNAEFTANDLLQLVFARKAELKLSKEDIAELSGLSRSVVNAVETGIVSMRSESVTRYRKAIDDYRATLSGPEQREA